MNPSVYGKPAVLSTPLPFTTPLRQRVVVLEDRGADYLLLWFGKDTPGSVAFGVDPRKQGERFLARKDRVEVLQ